MKIADRPPHIKVVTAKGGQYVYFNAGANDNGKARYVPVAAESRDAFSRDYSRLCQERAKADATPKTLKDAAIAFERTKRFRSYQATTQRSYSAAIGRLVDLHGTKRPQDVSRDDVVGVLSAIANRTVRTVTAKTLSAFFVWMRQSKIMPDTCNPMDGLISRARQGRTGSVYFLRAGDDGPIKIGRAEDVKRRCRYASSFPKRRPATFRLRQNTIAALPPIVFAANGSFLTLTFLPKLNA